MDNFQGYLRSSHASATSTENKTTNFSNSSIFTCCHDREKWEVALIALPTTANLRAIPPVDRMLTVKIDGSCSGSYLRITLDKFEFESDSPHQINAISKAVAGLLVDFRGVTHPQVKLSHGNVTARENACVD